MFAGIVEDAGRVLSLEEQTEAWLLKLTLPFADGDGLEAGSSLSVNGCCLTLRENSDGKEASFDLLEETMERTNLSGVTEGSLVNLERSLPANGRVGGHFVTGHAMLSGKSRFSKKGEKSLPSGQSPSGMFSVFGGQRMHRRGWMLPYGLRRQRRVFCHLADTSYVGEDEFDGTQTRRLFERRV